MATESEFLAVTGSELAATTFENGVLTGDKSTMPACAQAVLDGRGAAPDYWAWLIVAWYASEIGRTVELAGECSAANPYEVQR